MEIMSRPPVVYEAPPRNQDSEDGTSFDLSGLSAKFRFREFFRNFRIGNFYIYRDLLLRQWNKRDFFVEVDLSHVNEFDQALLNCIQTNPIDYIPMFELGAKEALKQFLTQQGSKDLDQEDTPDFQILFRSGEQAQSIRSLTADHVNKFIKVPGIVIKCSEVRPKATKIMIRCTQCGHNQTLSSKSAIGGVTIPPQCIGNQPGSCQEQKQMLQAKGGGLAPTEGGKPGGAGRKMAFRVGTYAILSDQCQYVDQQAGRLQEGPGEAPTGEMPRNIQLILERYLVDRVSPGARVSVLAVYCLSSTSSSSTGGKGGSALRAPYLRVVGIEVEGEGRSGMMGMGGGGSGGRTVSIYTPQEEEYFQSLARRSDIYSLLSRSIAPQISGEYTKDIKKGLLCLLLGGSRKTLPDQVKLRGDINVLLMGDPSTAKSQFLKFVERVAPIGVYTSGKGSSAAGLTASISRDQKGEFYLEAGAMVLADGGIICIDEFDKMREVDRVSLHEGMEQQTLSIAKAGLTTMLNCRVGVLAAANPIYGRYDDLKSVGENIELMSTILSRFDMIFLVRDVRERRRDLAIADHVLSIHMKLGGGGGGGGKGSGHSSLSNSSSSSSSSKRSRESGPTGVGGGGGGGGVTGSSAESGEGVDGEDGEVIDVHTLRRFISYCRERCAPRLNDEAAAILSSHYVQIRNRSRLLNEAQLEQQQQSQSSYSPSSSSSSPSSSSSFSSSSSSSSTPTSSSGSSSYGVRAGAGGGAGGGGVSSPINITVRQLEAKIRIAEALAKMRLSPEATGSDVREAIRLFTVSTLSASEGGGGGSSGSGVGVGGGGGSAGVGTGGVSLEEIKKAEGYLGRRMGIRMVLNTKKLLEEAQLQGYRETSIRMALGGMVTRGEIQELNQGKLIRRVK